MASFKVPLKIDQGSDFSKLSTWKTGTPAVPVDLTGCTAEAHVRPSISSDTKLLVLTTANGGIVLGGLDGTIEIVITAAQTEGSKWRSGVYDLEITFPSGRKRRLMSGSVSLSPEGTRDDA